MSVTNPELGSAPPTVQVDESGADPLIGIDLGGFKVVKLLAAGGMGLVYEAMHPAIGRRAAVKVLKPEVAADAEWTKRFLSEARALGAIKHRNLIEVLNFGKTPDGREFLMMEFLDGEPLDAYIRRLGQLAPAVALGIADQILNGLAEAHKKGVVHRDLKPANVYLLREHNGELLVKVLDFGLARQEPIAILDAAVNLPKRDDGASLLAGTPEYIAPEQAQGMKVEGSADLYSLGVMLFEMVSGQLPFEADTVVALLQKHVSERAPRLSSVMNNVPEGLEEFIEGLLLKEPELRPKSADAARVTVQRLLKRLSQDSTAVRMNPAMEEFDPKRAPTAKINRVEVTTDKALLAAFPEKKSRGWMVGVLALLLLLGSGLIWKLSGREEVPVVKEAPVAVAPPTPEPVKVEPAVAITPVAPNPVPEQDTVEALPKIAKAEAVKPTPTLKLAPSKKVTIERASCDPTEDWRKRIQGNVTELGNLVINDPKLNATWDRDGRVVSGLAENAKTVGECVATQAAFDKLRAALGH
ncbi:MAG: protein kinase [Archangium sp.]|nr:protein kinase [Archangium sp.]MDP3154069.1 protein kinase [Archangium sp.]MDP3570027.1 protein kinase [Archangium sp.]